MVRRSLFGVASALLALSAMLAMTMRSHDGRGDAANTAVRRMMARIRQRAETLARIVLPRAGPLTVRVEGGIGDASRRVFSVTFSDQEGAEVLHSTWGADRGDLIAASTLVRHPAGSALVQDSRTAARIAWDWARGIGIADTEKAWTTERVIHRTKSRWWCVFVSPTTRASVEIDAGDGGLVMAIVSSGRVEVGTEKDSQESRTITVSAKRMTPVVPGDP